MLKLLSQFEGDIGGEAVQTLPDRVQRKVGCTGKNVCLLNIFCIFVTYTTSQKFGRIFSFNGSLFSRLFTL